MMKKLALIGLVGGVALAAGTAFALWTANGSGSGSANSVTAVTVTVDAVTGAADRVADVVTMNAGALDGCQGKSFTISLTLAGGQSS